MTQDASRANQRASGNSIQIGRTVVGSAINTGAGVSIAIYQASAAASPVDTTPTLGGLIESILELSAKEQRSFRKFAATAFGELTIDRVDGLALKRLQAYVDAIVDRREGRGT